MNNFAMKELFERTARTLFDLDSDYFMLAQEHQKAARELQDAESVAKLRAECRYRVEQQGFWWWVIKMGDGARTIFKAHTRDKALDMVAKLNQAFSVGMFVALNDKESPALPVDRDLLLGAIARGWCSPENERKEMDAVLAQAIAREVLAYLERTP